MTDAAAHRTPLDTRAIWAIALPAMVTNVATAMIEVGAVSYTHLTLPTILLV